MPVDAQIVVEGSFQDEQVVNVFGVRSTADLSPLTSLDANDLFESFEALFLNNSATATPNKGLRDFRPNDHVVDRIVVREVLPGGAIGPVFEFPVNIPGSSNADPAPMASSLIVAWRTGTAGRSGRGRSYLGPFTEDQMDNVGDSPAQWDATLVGEATAAIADLQARLQAQVPAYSMAVYSRVDQVFRIVTSFRINSKINNQRRRQKDVSPAFAQVTTF